MLVSTLALRVQQNRMTCKCHTRQKYKIIEVDPFIEQGKQILICFFGGVDVPLTLSILNSLRWWWLDKFRWIDCVHDNNNNNV